MFFTATSTITLCLLPSNGSKDTKLSSCLKYVKRAITKNICNVELWFLYTAQVVSEVYLHTTLEVDTF